MKIVTWNINSLRLRLEQLDNIAQKLDVDIICLQETKVPDELFPDATIRQMGFEYMVFTGEKSYNGVAILSKFPITHSFSLNLCERKRHIAAVINGIEIHNFYIPAGGDIPDPEENPKFKYKLEHLNLANEWLEQNRKKTDKIILLGDLNIAPFEHDVWSSKQLKNVVSHTDVERKLLLKLCASLDFIDTGRHFVPKSEKLYSWWSYRSPNWEASDRGRRLDHIWVTHPLKDVLKATFYDKDTRRDAVTSDHIPCMIELSI